MVSQPPKIGQNVFKKKKNNLNSPRDLCNLLFRFAVNDMSMIKCFLKIYCTDQGKNFGKPPSFPLGWKHLVLFCFLILAVLGLCWGMLVGSLVVVCGLSCSAAPGMLVPWSEIEPVSPALEGRFFTTGPPGKSQETCSPSRCVSTYTTQLAFPSLPGVDGWWWIRSHFEMRN